MLCVMNSKTQITDYRAREQTPGCQEPGRGLRAAPGAAPGRAVSRWRWWVHRPHGMNTHAPQHVSFLALALSYDCRRSNGQWQRLTLVGDLSECSHGFL